MNVYTKRLGGPIESAGAPITIGTVPANKVWIVRAIHITNSATATAGDARISIGADAAATRVCRVAVPAVSQVIINTYLALSAGELLKALSSGSNLTFTVTGYEFST